MTVTQIWSIWMPAVTPDDEAGAFDWDATDRDVAYSNATD